MFPLYSFESIINLIIMRERERERANYRRIDRCRREQAMLRDYSRVEIKAGDGRSGLYHLVASKRFVKSTCSAAGDRPTGVLLQTISRSCDLGRNSCAIYHQQRFGDRVTAPLLPPFIERKPRKEAMHWGGVRGREWSREWRGSCQVSDLQSMGEAFILR